MIQNTTTPAAIVVPAENFSAFAIGAKAAADRTAEIRRKATIVGIDVGSGFVNDWTAAKVEKAYQAAMAEVAKNPLFTPEEAQEYHDYLDSINADLDAAAASPVSQVEELHV